MSMRSTPVTADAFATLDGLDDWRFLVGGIHATFRAGSFPRAAAFIAEVAEAAEAADHHPDIEMRYPDRVMVHLTTHDAGGLTTADVDLARTVSSISRRVGATVEALTTLTAGELEFAIDTTDADRIRPFWQAVLGHRDRGGVLVDPLRSAPSLWFQHSDEERPGRGRFHIDVTVPHDVAEQRVAAALAAGGRLVTDQFARSWWVLSDADGNEACICTWQDRTSAG